MQTPTTKIMTQPSQAQPAKPKPRHPKIVRKPTLGRHNVAALVATKLHVSANKSRQIVDAVLEAVKSSVRSGHVVELRGFCKFEVRNVKARSRVNMADVKAGLKGAAVGRLVVPAHAVVKATASPVFLNGKRGSDKVCK